MATTLRVRGEGGAEFDLDVPEEGSYQRELLEEAIEKGRITVLDGEMPADPGTDAEPTSDVPDGNMAEVVEWVRGAPSEAEPAEGWEDRARQALDAEQAQAKPRTTLVDLLEAALTPPADPGIDA